MRIGFVQSKQPGIKNGISLLKYLPLLILSFLIDSDESLIYLGA